MVFSTSLAWIILPPFDITPSATVLVHTRLKQTTHYFLVLLHQLLFGRDGVKQNNSAMRRNNADSL